METFELILLLLVAVLISAVVEKLVPRVSLPLIQIAIGFVIAVMAARPINIDFEPDFFLLVFIAPLLFHDAKESDKLGLWKNRNLILMLAVGLVVVIMLAVGFTVHLMEPSIPLAAALALGAALGPTDAVAVASLSGVAAVDRKESALLSGESLLNDASGVVAFQFAIAAAVTGTFAVVDATIDFVIAFFGGIIIGALVGWASNAIQRRVDRLGLDSTAFHVMLDVALPFIIYLLCEVLGVSGILGVVAAGIVLSAIKSRDIGPAAAQLSIVTNSTWSVVSFALNGIVFTLLGMQLPRATQSTWDNVAISNTTIVLYVLAITAILVLVRFLWVLGMDYFMRDPDTGTRREEREGRIRSALITTIGGPKGAVTLSVILSTPFLVASGRAFPQRDLIIFLASGVILCTLLLANFLLPVLAPKPEDAGEETDEERALSQLEIFRSVIERLSAMRTRENAAATSMVIDSYNQRIRRAQSKYDLDTVDTADLRIEVIKDQIDYLFDLMDSGQVDEYEGYRYMRRLAQAMNSIKNNRDRRFNLHSIKRFFMRIRDVYHSWRSHRSSDERKTEQIDIQVKVVSHAVEKLNDMLFSDDAPYPTEVITRVLLSHQQALRTLKQQTPSITTYARTAEHTERIERIAYGIELEEIQNALDRGDISRALAKQMRDNVYLMMVDLEVIGAE